MHGFACAALQFPVYEQHIIPYRAKRANSGEYGWFVSSFTDGDLGTRKVRYGVVPEEGFEPPTKGL